MTLKASLEENIGADAAQARRDEINKAHRGKKNGDTARDNNEGVQALEERSIASDLRELLLDLRSDVRSVQRTTEETLAGMATIAANLATTSEKVQAVEKRVEALESKPAPSIAEALNAVIKLDGEAGKKARTELSGQVHDLLDSDEWKTTRAIKRATRGGFLGFVSTVVPLGIGAAALGVGGYYGGTYGLSKIRGN
jgi:hypothetical protein